MNEAIRRDIARRRMLTRHPAPKQPKRRKRDKTALTLLQRIIRSGKLRFKR